MSTKQISSPQKLGFSRGTQVCGKTDGSRCLVILSLFICKCVVSTLLLILLFGKSQVAIVPSDMLLQHRIEEFPYRPGRSSPTVNHRCVLVYSAGVSIRRPNSCKHTGSHLVDWNQLHHSNFVDIVTQSAK